MKLYHFTTRDHHWPRIEAAGYLKVTESNISDRRPHAGPDVVWLTDDPEPSIQRWGLPSATTLRLKDIASGAFGAVSLPAAQAEGLKTRGQVGLHTADKTVVRITVEVPDDEAHHWPEWSRRQGIRNMLYKALALAGGDPEQWWVVARPIPREEWVEIVDTGTGEVLWTRQEETNAVGRGEGR